MTGVHGGPSGSEMPALLTRLHEHKKAVTKGWITPTNEKKAQKMPGQSEGATKKDA